MQRKKIKQQNLALVSPLKEKKSRKGTGISSYTLALCHNSYHISSLGLFANVSAWSATSSKLSLSECYNALSWQCYQPRRSQVIPKSVLRKKRSFKRQGSQAGRGKHRPFLPGVYLCDLVSEVLFSYYVICTVYLRNYSMLTRILHWICCCSIVNCLV